MREQQCYGHEGYESQWDGLYEELPDSPAEKYSERRELSAGMGMLNPGFRHRRRRERSETAHKRQINKLAVSMHYHRQNDGSYIECQFGHTVEDERELRALARECQSVYKYDRNRRGRLYHSGASATIAIAEEFDFESCRSRPGGFGISRQAKKLEQRIYQAYKYQSQFDVRQMQMMRKMARLARQLRRIKEKMAETKKQKGQSRLAMNAREVSAITADGATDDYLLGCEREPGDDWPLDDEDDDSSFGMGDLSADEYYSRYDSVNRILDDEEEVERASLIEESIAAKQKRIAELRSYEFPEQTPQNKLYYGSFNASLRDQIKQLELEINELQRKLKPQT